MTTLRFCTPASRIAFAAFMLHGVVAGAAPLDFTGRGVWHFASASGCPPGGLGATHAECNRIAIDLPDGRAAVDADKRTIVFSSDATQKDETMVGDVLLHGSGISEQGQRVPLSLHLLLRREGKQWDLDSYVHVPVGGKFTNVTIDPYEISVLEGAKKRVLVTPERARRLFAEPSLRRRLARALVSVHPTTSAGKPVQDDITVALGLGRVTTSVMRVGFTSGDPASAGDLERTFKGGNWAIRLEALSNRIPLWVVQRQLFLFGLDTHPAMRTVAKAGFKEHDTLTFGTRGGKGFVGWNGQESAFDGAAASGHAFLQESFMGLILAWQHGRASPTAAAAPARPAAPAPRT